MVFTYSCQTNPCFRSRKRQHSSLSSDRLGFFQVARFKQSHYKIELNYSIYKANLLNTVTDAIVFASVWFFAYAFLCFQKRGILFEPSSRVLSQRYSAKLPLKQIFLTFTKHLRNLFLSFFSCANAKAINCQRNILCKNKIPHRYQFLTLSRFSEDSVMSRTTSLVSLGGFDAVIRWVFSLTCVSDVSCME